MDYDIDWHEFEGNRKWYGDQKRLVPLAASMMLNNFAFDVRRQAITVINRTMIVRNKRFVDTRLKVTKARSGASLNQMQSITGAIRSERFSGWVEQELGKQTIHNRFATLAGRGGDKSKQIRPSVRLKRSNEVITPDKLNPKGGPRNIGGIIAMMKRTSDNRLIRIGGVIMKRKRNKLEVVQILRKQQPKRNRWLTTARSAYFRRTNIQAMWASTVKKLMRPPNR